MMWVFLLFIFDNHHHHHPTPTEPSSHPLSHAPPPSPTSANPSHCPTNPKYPANMTSTLHQDQQQHYKSSSSPSSSPPAYSQFPHKNNYPHSHGLTLWLPQSLLSSLFGRVYALYFTPMMTKYQGGFYTSPSHEVILSRPCPDLR